MEPGFVQGTGPAWTGEPDYLYVDRFKNHYGPATTAAAYLSHPE